jgi:sirohydrochlorin ferrochelatase/(2Fe-2S) ferredoxin
MSSTARPAGAEFTRGAEATSPLILLLGHGSRDPSAVAEHESLARAYRARRPELAIGTAYIELAEPLLEDGLRLAAGQAARVVVVPSFLFGASHVKNDVPLALEAARARFPGVTFAAAPPLGVHPSLIELAWERAARFIPDESEARKKTLLLVVGRGASDPDANGDFCKIVRLVGERRDLMHVEPTFVGITEPRVEATLDRVACMRPERLVVLPYLLFAGRLLTRLGDELGAFARRHPWIKTALAPHLGIDEKLLSVIDERARQALDGHAFLPCDTCQYRTAMPGVAREVGGLRALLYSVRHTMTHAQARLPEHAHKPLKKHVLVCGNIDCVERGSIAVLDAMRRSVQVQGRAREIRVTRTACMGRCGEGPTVAVYPDGVWYRGVRPSDVDEIVREHLVEDRLVARLVDDILH